MDNTGQFELFIKYVLEFLCAWIPADKHFFFLFVSGSLNGLELETNLGAQKVLMLLSQKVQFQYAIWMKFSIRLRVRTHESVSNKPHVTMGALFRGLDLRDPEKTSRKTEGEGKARYFCILFMSTDQTLGELCNPVV